MNVSSILIHPVDVIIPVNAGLEETCAAIETAAATIDPRFVRLVVINDCSPDPSITLWLRDNQPRLGYELLENETNLGFVGTVNRGMALNPDADVLLLNSDVEVANDWLERLQQTAYSRPMVASVTATANNATICSFPVFCEDNALPKGLSLNQIDTVFKQTIPAATCVEIPTGVGCCMYMRRDAIKTLGLFDAEVYGRGYGEENDWCQKAIANGWVNLHALNVFVYHKGAVSFAEESNPRKQANLDTLIQRFPSYNADVQRFIAADPARLWRMSALVRLLATTPLPKVLMIAHGMGGGVYTHLRELVNEQRELQYLLLEPVADGVVRLHLQPFAARTYLDFQMDQDYDRLLEVLRAVGVSHLHFHHTMGLPTRIWGLPNDLELVMDFTLHDYVIVNGNPALMDSAGRFVGDHPERDSLCAEHVPLPPGVSARQWRQNQLLLLERARYLICPSEDMYRRLSAIPEFAHLDTWVVSPHMDNHRLDTGLRPRAKSDNEPLRVLVLGALSPEKGADILEKVAQQTRHEGIEFHLLGYAYRLLDESVTTHGAYQESQVAELIDHINPHVVWFPSQCAETYSYTLSLALEAGLPVVASNLGAFPERLAGRSGSVLFQDYQSSEAWTDFWRGALSRFDHLLLESVDPTLAPKLNVLFYHRAYTQGMMPVVDCPVVSVDLLAAQLQQASSSDRQQGRRKRLFDYLLSVMGTRWGAGLARLIPVRLQRKVKRMLLRGAVHDN
jgi:GT2 family glycosyltransferase/glycosyltransferase involved in cell wall biosynthesis